MIEYTQYLQLPIEYIKSKILDFLEEDIPLEDITTNNIINKEQIIKAQIQAVEKFTFVGSQIIPHFFDNRCEVNIHKIDGESAMSGEILGTIIGPSQILLSRERIMLNLIQRLCGIATEAKKYSILAKEYNIKILDTRKTTPGLRLFEKHAIVIGGCQNHRLNLSNGILIKDNHIYASGSIVNAIKSLKKSNNILPIQVEVENLNQIKDSLELAVDGYLLDNMPTEKIKQAVALIRNHTNGKNIFIEVSGGINMKNITSFLKTGINAISVGSMIHGAKSKDIRFEFIACN